MRMNRSLPWTIHVTAQAVIIILHAYCIIIVIANYTVRFIDTLDLRDWTQTFRNDTQFAYYTQF